MAIRKAHLVRRSCVASLRPENLAEEVVATSIAPTGLAAEDAGTDPDPARRGSSGDVEHVALLLSWLCAFFFSSWCGCVAPFLAATGLLTTMRSPAPPPFTAGLEEARVPVALSATDADPTPVVGTTTLGSGGEDRTCLFDAPVLGSAASACLFPSITASINAQPRCTRSKPPSSL